MLTTYFVIMLVERFRLYDFMVVYVPKVLFYFPLTVVYANSFSSIAFLNKTKTLSHFKSYQ